MGAAIRCGDGVAVGTRKAIGLAEARWCPGDGPLDLALVGLDQAGKGFRRNRFLALEDFLKLIGEAVVALD